MSALQAILDYCGTHDNVDTTAIATVVYVDGSAYRHPGARMLVTADGERIGCVSGSCLEADVVQRCAQVAASRKPMLVVYDARSTNGDLVLELGCGAAIHILIEPLADAIQTLDLVGRMQSERLDTVMATVYAADGRIGNEVGHGYVAKFDSDMGGDFYPGAETPALPKGKVADGTNNVKRELNPLEFSDISDEQLRTLIRTDSLGVPCGTTENRHYRLPSGSVSVLLESIRKPTALVVFGANSGSVAIAKLARQLGWATTVIDRNAAALRREYYPGAELVRASREEPIPDILLDERTAAIVVTHDYETDWALVARLLASPAGYIGMVGSRSRSERVLSELVHSGVRPSDEQLRRFRSPAGLDIGANSPDEIALAICAEINATFTNRPGGPLRKQ